MAPLPQWSLILIAPVLGLLMVHAMVELVATRLVRTPGSGRAKDAAWLRERLTEAGDHAWSLRPVGDTLVVRWTALDPATYGGGHVRFDTRHRGRVYLDEKRKEARVFEVQTSRYSAWGWGMFSAMFRFGASMVTGPASGVLSGVAVVGRGAARREQAYSLDADKLHEVLERTIVHTGWAYVPVFLPYRLRHAYGAWFERVVPMARAWSRLRRAAVLYGLSWVVLIGALLAALGAPDLVGAAVLAALLVAFWGLPVLVLRLTRTNG